MKLLAQIKLQRQRQLEAVTALLKQDMQDMFMGLPVDTIKEMIERDEGQVLNTLMEIALETENYTICEAVRQVIAERKYQG